MSNGTILYVGNYELPDKNAAAHRVIANGKIFRELGYRVAYLGVVRDTEHFDGIRRADYMPDVYEEAYPASGKEWLRHVFDVSNILETVSKYGDVRMVILYNVPYATLKRVKHALRNTEIKVCYDCTEWNNWAEGSLPKRLYKKIDARQIENRVGRKADGMIVISSMMMKKYGGQAVSVKLPPLVDTDDPIWHQEKKQHEGFEFCFAGTIGNKESLEKIISAFGRLELSDTVLRIIGLNKEKFLGSHPEYREQIDRLGDRIVFMGMLPHTEAVRNVLSCDTYIFVRESIVRNEAGFPTKFVEAFTSGVPIITTNVSDVKEYMNLCGGGILLQSCGEDEILDAMRRSAENRGSGSGLRDTFDYRSFIQITKAWIEKVIK